MRLVCVGDNGESLDMVTAIQRDPYVVRGLLVDAIIQCQQSISDTLDFIHAERAVRDALLAFQGTQDRYARAYVLSRTLDHRNRNTPRADLISLAFGRGGPLSLVGIFNATSDAHRNPHSREILDYFLKTASHESQLQLIMRASTFPCHPSMSEWLSQILDKLAPNPQNLACVLRCLGTSCIPNIVFHRMQAPSLSWGEDGEVAETSPPINTVADEGKLMPALQRLEHVGFVRVSEKTVDLDRRISELLRARLERTRWIAEAIRIMAHSFPKYPLLPPGNYDNVAHLVTDASTKCNYVGDCETLQRQLESVFSYLGPLQLETLVDGSCLVQLVETCLSTSYFGNKSWKYTAMEIAARAVKGAEGLPYGAVLAARVQVRRATLADLYEEASQSYETITFPISDHRSNAFSADLAILKARGCIRLNALASALRYLASFKSSWGGVVSSLGLVQESKVALMRARILRFEGRFQESYDLLRSLRLTDNKVVSLLGTILCELQRCEEGIELLDAQVKNRTDLRGMKRVKIALGNAYLIWSMQKSLQGLPLDWRSLQIAQDIFQELAHSAAVATYFDKIDHLSILFGLAIVHHMNGRVDSALAAWEKALTTSRAYLNTGYTDMIISCSNSELEARRGAMAQANAQGDYAETLFARTGRQHHFAGLGSVWPDLISKWLVSHGRKAIIPP
ncbi:hypothetical protein F4815DRAFT_484673 [Daldinia loculata]|nr:hypothetical protein F4815DRAFT_484673 [Daldinia loculata]